MSRITYLTLYTPQESNLNQLQTAFEHHLSKLHFEKKQEKSLNSQIKTLESKISNLKSQKPDQPANELSKIVFSLTKQIEVTKSQIQQVQGENFELKKKIENLRLETSNSKRIIGELAKDVEKSSKVARVYSQSRMQIRNEESNNKGKIQEILNKSSTDKVVLSEKIINLRKTIFNTQREEVINTKMYSERLEVADNEIDEEIDMNCVGCIKTSCVSRLKSLRKKFVSYKKQIKNLRQSFEEMMKKGTKTDLKEFALEFTESERNQINTSLYLMKLNSEMDSLTISNNQILKRSDIQKTSKSSLMMQNLKNELKQAKNKLDLVDFKSKSILNTLERTENLINVIFIQETFVLFIKIPDSKRPFSIQTPSDSSLTDKLSILDQLLHQCMILKSFMSKKASSFGSLHQSQIINYETSGLALKTIRHLIKQLSIASDSDSEENSEL